MAEESASAVVSLDEEVPISSRSVSAARRRKIRLFSRVGLWGLVVGMVPVAASVISDTWSWTVAPGFSIPNLGFMIGGAGIASASFLALRELGRGLRPVKLAALAAVPLGAALVVLGSMHLSSPWIDPTELSVAIFNFVFQTAGLLVAVVVAMLAVAFVTSIRDEPGGEAL